MSDDIDSGINHLIIDVTRDKAKRGEFVKIVTEGKEPDNEKITDHVNQSLKVAGKTQEFEQDFGKLLAGKTVRRRR
jgi:hypothetical protein